MFGFLATFLAGPYGFLLKIGAVVAIVGGIYLYGRHAGVESMVPKVEAAESAALLWQTTAANRLKLMQAQNLAVEALKTAHDTKLKIRDAKLTDVKREADKWRDVAQRREEILANLELPPGECDSLFVLIDAARSTK